MKKVLYLIALFISIGIFALAWNYSRNRLPTPETPFASIGPETKIVDASSDLGKSIIASARNQIGVVIKYDTAYFADALVPPDSGVCADVVWRALKDNGYDLRTEVDNDIKNNPNDYQNVDQPDNAIDFRRVKNLKVFFDKYAKSLTLDVISGSIENLSYWQAGDLVTFAPLPESGLTHIAIVSDKRRRDGVPLLIHNYGRGTVEDDYLTNWPSEITGHYRLDKLIKKD